jgi:hypothetical protein
MPPILNFPDPSQSQPKLLEDELLEDELLLDELLLDELLLDELPAVLLLLLSHWSQFSSPKNGPRSMSVCTAGS